MEFLSNIAPILEMSGDILCDLDVDEGGADDFAGQTLRYAGQVLTAVAHGQDLPDLPPLLAKGTSDKITGKSLMALQLASKLLYFAPFFAKGKAATPIRYVRLVIDALLKGANVPGAPAALAPAVVVNV